MTLCLAWVEKNNLYAISDSRVSSGPEKIDCFAKIDTFGEGNLFVAWEGYTGYTLPILKDLSRLVSTSPLFHSWSGSTTAQMLAAIKTRMDLIWGAIERDLSSDDPSFLVGTYDFDADRPRIFRFFVDLPKAKGSAWVYEEAHSDPATNPLGLASIGSGKSSFHSRLGENFAKRTQILKSFSGVLDDPRVGCTGGIPHIVKLDRRGPEIFGLKANGRKYYLSTEESVGSPFPKSIKFIELGEFKQGVMEC